MDILDESLLNLWSSLNQGGVRYIMIGGFAVNFNGFARFTHDVDILLEDKLENRIRFRKALKQAGVGDFELIETMEFIPGFTTIMLDGGMELDLFTSLPGYEKEAFETLFNLAPIANIEDVQVPFLHINHLIHSKKVSNRPKDKVDVEALEEIKSQMDF